MSKFFVILITLFLSLCGDPKYYDSSLRQGYSLTAMGSKTAYVNNGLVAYRERVKSGDRLVHMNLLFRHGTRSPEKAFMKKMKRWAQHFKSRKELSDFNFTLNCGGTMSKELLPTGERELQDLGIRWRSRVSLRFRQPLYAQVYVSPTNRTAASARAFVSKFFDNPSSVHYEEDYQRLRFFDTCTRYTRTIRKNKTLLVEWYAFQKGPEMKKVLGEVVADNNLYDLNITLDDLEDFYKMASHEASVMQPDEKVSGWLKLFRPEHLYVLEYLHDLKALPKLTAV
uniref:Multiple inositol polyphosphate phosphatase 1 n=1 Tax=Schistocephalus solidus TaxID=70667 RepID=A0A0X3P8U8_SCHSO